MASAKKSFPIVLAVLAALLVINTAIATILPTEHALYSGTSYYDRDFNGRRVNYAVYDTTNENIPESSDTATLLDGVTSRYLYAYQIFNGDNSPVDSIDAFSILDIGVHTDNPVVRSMEDILDPDSEQGDDYDFVPVVDQFYALNDDDDGYASWYFEGDNGVTIAKGGRSIWLLIESDNAAIIGDYEFRGGPGNILGFGSDGVGSGESGDERYPATIPEPITITLLGIGGLILRRTGKKA